MDCVFIENEAFKITLQIVEDFIGEDYDGFIKNGPTDDIKLIKWKMEIYFKKLEGKKNSTIEYYMTPIYETMKKDVQKNFKYKISKTIYYTFSYSNISYVIDTMNIDFEKNIFTKTITINFICDETYKCSCRHVIENPGMYNSPNDPDKFYNYLNQMRYIIYRLFYYNDDLSFKLVLHKYDNFDDSSKKHIINNNDDIKLQSDKVLWFKDVVKKHYGDILINLEAYSEYYKAIGVDIDFEKITERIKYFKDYVKDNYDITLD